VRYIDTIVIHCSATPPDMDVHANDIRLWHMRGNGWKDIGYNYVIPRDGTVENGRDLDKDGDVDEEIGAHAYGFNSTSIGICLVGGLNKDRKPDANFTLEQYIACDQLVNRLTTKYSTIKTVCGHRDLKGVKKACPSFDAKEMFKRYSRI
jgi:N-acetyl-anhydromuramyl-L-alanine amidase AmpD